MGTIFSFISRYKILKKTNKMCSLQFTFLGGLVHLTSCGKCLGDGEAEERWLYCWPGPLEFLRANDAGMFLVIRYGSVGESTCAGSSQACSSELP